MEGTGPIADRTSVWETVASVATTGQRCAVCGGTAGAAQREGAGDNARPYPPISHYPAAPIHTLLMGCHPVRLLKVAVNGTPP